MKKQFVKPEIKGIRLRSRILAGSGTSSSGASCSSDYGCLKNQGTSGCYYKCEFESKYDGKCSTHCEFMWG